MKNIYQDISFLIDNINLATLPEELSNYLQRIIKFDGSLIMLFYQNKSPLVLYNDLEHSWRENTIKQYINAAYLLDPFYLMTEMEREGDLFRLLDIAPDGFTESKYYCDYYLHLQIRDELCFLIPVKDDATFCISLQRKNENSSFSVKERKSLVDILPLLDSVIKKHFVLNVDKVFIQQSDFGRALKSAFNCFASSVLTKRECEVVKYMLKGHSIRSSAEKMNISPGTIKVHREKIYFKLDISSQAELFHLFIDSVSNLKSGFSGDPLIPYTN